MKILWNFRLITMLKNLFNPDGFRSEQNCGGCSSPIRDRFYLLAADKAWHGKCLRCCKCSQLLDTELSCFTREGNIYCKEDYFRCCAKCGAALSSSDLVMRARELVFHVNCFSCSFCGVLLSAGDTAALRGKELLCGEHYDIEIVRDDRSTSTPTFQYYIDSAGKGRIRKRKSLHTDDSTDLSSEREYSPMSMEMLSGDLDSTSLNLSPYETNGPGGTLSGQIRAKRMRTSFKHHQLRTMKSYFSINQNPDAKDLKQLSQKTGLSKRVLQVWFQNARAKWRRNVLRQEINPNQMPNNDSKTSPSTPNLQVTNGIINGGVESRDQWN